MQPSYNPGSLGFRPKRGNQMMVGREAVEAGFPSTYRLVEIFDEIQAKWRFIPMKELEMGQLFRLYESGRVSLRDPEGYVEFESLSSPELSPEGVWVVQYMGVNKEYSG